MHRLVFTYCLPAFKRLLNPRYLGWLVIPLLSLTTACAGTTPEEEATPVFTYQIVNSYYHDTGAFTQGLVYEEGILYEGTGLYGQSTLQKVDMESGRVQQIYRLPKQYFGEGITVFQDRVFQLTWREKTGFIYDRDSFELIGSFQYSTEGWGLTNDGTHLIMSDGTSSLYFLNPQTLEVVRQINVSDNGAAVSRLNELEYIDGEIYANIWQTERIARISPETGEVNSWINLVGLLDWIDYQGYVDVLNGIAYDGTGDRLLVTGKFWPRIFEIKLVPAADAD